MLAREHFCSILISCNQSRFVPRCKSWKHLCQAGASLVGGILRNLSFCVRKINSCQCCLLNGQEEGSTKKAQGSPFEHTEVHFYFIFNQEVGWKWHKLMQNVFSFPPWKCSEVIWTWSQANCYKWLWLSRNVGVDSLEKALTASSILGFWYPLSSILRTGYLLSPASPQKQQLVTLSLWTTS